MKGIITVVGMDRVGIIARICVYLSNEEINILDLSQTIIQGIFNMIMIVDLSQAKRSFEEVALGLAEVGESIGMQVELQREDIFNSMHRI